MRRPRWLIILNWFTLIAEILAIAWIHWVLSLPPAAKAGLKPMTIAIWSSVVVLVIMTLAISKQVRRSRTNEVCR